MMKRFFQFLGVLPLVLCFAGCFSRGESLSKNSSQARLNLPNWGIVVDANYDRKLDNLVPGYKIVTVALTNRSYDVVKLDPIHDVWTIEDAWGRKQRAIVSLRIRDPKTWTNLPPRVKDLIEYPAGVQVNYTQTFNLFFPESVDLSHFRSISFYCGTLKQNFDAVSSEALERGVPTVSEPPRPAEPEIIIPPRKSFPKKTSPRTR